ncbi:tonB-system energizer ExbB [Dongia sp.]|uniref:tonB-system energizer ExbB n=1 Tax=Dongia sp. TaxID=1977262 RepID=UPI0035AE3827
MLKMGSFSGRVLAPIGAVVFLTLATALPAAAQEAPATTNVPAAADPSAPAPTTDATVTDATAAGATPTDATTGAVPAADGLPPGTTETVDGYLLGPDGQLLLGPDGQPLMAEEVAGNLPHDLSPWGMFMQADWVVKTVMIGLAFASVVTWTVWLVTSLELMAARRQARRARATLADVSSLAEAVAVAQSKEGELKEGAARDLIAAAAHEMHISTGLPAEGIKERVASRLERIEAAAQRYITRGTGILATIGSTAPFVGLFGTVWGIMNSFIGISKAQTTNLAVVAPGIAEALLATAIGLVAAIPAVVIYNKFSRSISGYRALLADISAELLRLVSRDLDQRRGTLREAAE